MCVELTVDFEGNDDTSVENGEDGEDEDPVASIVHEDDVDDDMDEDDDPMASIVAEVVAGCDPAATQQQKDRMKKLIADHIDYLSERFGDWFNSDNLEERRNAQLIVGYLGMDQIMNGTGPLIRQQRNNRARDDDDVPVPLGAPPSIHYLLNANQRSKLHRLASRVQCRSC